MENQKPDPKQIASKELQAKRREICVSCENAIGNNFCNGHECGCYMPINLYFEEDKCPKGKW